MSDATTASAASPDGPSTMRVLKRVPPVVDSLLRLLLGGLLGYAVLEYFNPEWQRSITSTTFDIGAGLLALLVVALASIIMAWRWQLVARVLHGEDYTFGIALRSFLLARFLGFFVSPVAMDLIGRRIGMHLQGTASSIANVTMQILVERWYDVLLPAIYLACSISGAFSQLDTWALITGACLAGVAIGMVTLVPIIGSLQWFHRRFLRQPLALPPPKLTWATLATIAGLGACRWLIIIWHTHTIAAAFGVDLRGEALVLGTATSQLAAVVSITPGGLGIQEAGWLLGLQNAAIPTEQSSVVAIVQRIGAASCFGILTAVTWVLMRCPTPTTMPRAGNM